MLWRGRMFFMSVNVFALYFLMKVVRQELASYASRLKSGEIRKFAD